MKNIVHNKAWMWRCRDCNFEKLYNYQLINPASMQFTSLKLISMLHKSTTQFYPNFNKNSPNPLWVTPSNSELHPYHNELQNILIFLYLHSHNSNFDSPTDSDSKAVLIYQVIDMSPFNRYISFNWFSTFNQGYIAFKFPIEAKFSESLTASHKICAHTSIDIIIRNLLNWYTVNRKL